MKLYQNPNGDISFGDLTPIGDTDDGWQVNDGDAPAYTALVEVVLRDGAKDTTPTLAGKYRWSISSSSHDIMAYRIIAPTPKPKPKTFSEIKVGDVVTVELTVTKVETRYWTTMFSCDTPEWFEAESAIGYLAPPPKPKIEAGQVRQIGHLKTTYLILVTPADGDRVVVGRADGPDSNPVLLERPAVEAAQVVS